MYISDVFQKLAWQLGFYSNKYDRRIREIQALNDESISLLPDLNTYYLPWTSASISPASLRTLLNEIIIHDRRKIVEFGCGISTVHMSKLFDEIGEGHLFFVESNADWLEKVITLVENEGVDRSRYTPIHAHMKKTKIDQKSVQWYDNEAIEEKLDGAVDMVFVDGPVGHGRAEDTLARFPALPFMYSYLEEDYVVFLDDVRREDESRIANMWSERYELAYSKAASLAVLRASSVDFTIL